MQEEERPDLPSLPQNEIQGILLRQERRGSGGAHERDVRGWRRVPGAADDATNGRVGELICLRLWNNIVGKNKISVVAQGGAV